MFFNPLFLQVINNQESLSTPKTQKLNGSSYLFSDIIKVCFDKNETENVKTGNESSEQVNISSVSNLLPGGLNIIGASDQLQAKDQSASAEQTLLNLMQNILPQKINITGAGENQSSLSPSGSSDNNMNSLILNEGEVTSLISKLLDNNYQGKINILSNKEGVKRTHHKSIDINSENNLSSDNLSPNELLDLLKQGNAVALESSGSENNPGLLISLVEVKNQNTKAGELSGGSLIENQKDISIDDSQDGKTINSNGSKDVKELLTATDNSNSSALQESPLLYQVELSIIQNNQNSAPELLSGNYSPNIEKLQELVNNKYVRFQDNNSVSTNALNQKQIFQDNQNLNLNAYNSGNYTEEVAKDKSTPSELINLTVDNQQQTPKVVGDIASANIGTGNIVNKNDQETSTSQISGISEQSQISELPIPKNPETKQNSNDVLSTEKGSFAQKSLESQIDNTKQTISNPKNISASPAVSFPKEIISGSENDSNTAEKNITSQNDFSENVGVNKPESLKVEDAFTAEESKLSAADPEKPDINKSEIDIQKNNSLTEEVNTPNPIVSNEIKTVQGKKSRIIKDLNLSIKSAKLKKEEQSIPEQTAAAQIPDVQKNKLSGRSEVSELNSPLKSAKIQDVSQHLDAKSEGGQISEKAFAKQAADLGSSANEKEINILSVDKNDNKSESAKNSNEENVAKDNSSGSKDTGHLTQDQQQQTASQDKNEFRSKVQENHVSGSDMVRNTDSTVKEKVPLEAKNIPNPIKTVKAAEIMKEISGFIQKNSDHTLTLKIDPENLGTVKIALDVVDKMIHANIEVENDAARKMVETNINQLYNSLNQSGVQINSLNISLANYDQKQSRGFSPKRKIYQTSGEEDYDEKNVSESRKMGYNTYEYLI